jgi:hypothetical protein
MANKEYDSPFPFKILTVLLLIMAGLSLRAQGDYQAFYNGNLKIGNTGMYIPGSWATASIARSPETIVIGFRINL